MPESDAERLISELLAEPRTFVEAGRPYALLQEYFAGTPLDSLRDLLRTNDPWIQRAAGFVASELGRAARGLEEDVIAVLSSSDVHAQNYAMEVLSVLSEDASAGLFVHVARKLESLEPGIRRLAMELVANASKAKLEAAARVVRTSTTKDERHERGLVAITRESPDRTEIAAMLRASERLLRQYGAIAMRRSSLSFADLGIGIDLVADSEIRQFVE